MLLKTRSLRPLLGGIWMRSDYVRSRSNAGNVTRHDMEFS